jgi:enhancing lycopene biosynthesis protein 2
MQNVGSPLADTTKQFILEILFEQIKCESDGCIFCYSTQFWVTCTYFLPQQISNEAAELQKLVTWYIIGLSQTSTENKH